MEKKELKCCICGEKRKSELLECKGIIVCDFCLEWAKTDIAMEDEINENIKKHKKMKSKKKVK